METSLNVTDCPEPKEQKCFVVECDCSCKGRFYVYASSEEEAEEILNINSPAYNDIEYTEFEIESVIGASDE